MLNDIAAARTGNAAVARAAQVALIVFGCLLATFPGVDDATAVDPFLPAYDLSVANPAAGANSDVAQRITLPAGHHVAASSLISIPAGRDIASDPAMPDSAIVGSGSVMIDVNCDSTVENYTLTLFEAGTSEPDEKTNWLATGLPFTQLNFVIRGSAASGHTIEALLFTGILMPPLCTPLDFSLSYFGVSQDNPNTGRDESGSPVITNPPAGIETWNASLSSAPLSFPPQHQLIACDTVAIGGAPPPPDSDSDGISDDCDNDADPDGDQFVNGIEISAGTDRLDNCADDPADDAWPADINNNGFSDTADIAALTAVFGQSVPPAPARYDIGPDIPNAFVDTADMARITGLFGQGCN